MLVADAFNLLSSEFVFLLGGTCVCLFIVNEVDFLRKYITSGKLFDIILSWMI